MEEPYWEVNDDEYEVVTEKPGNELITNRPPFLYLYVKDTELADMYGPKSIYADEQTAQEALTTDLTRIAKSGGYNFEDILTGCVEHARQVIKELWKE